MKFTTRRALSACVLAFSAVLAVSAPATAHAVPASVADHCAEAAPALLLEGPAHTEPGGTVELLATYRCVGDPAVGALLHIEGVQGSVDFDSDGRVILQVPGEGTYRLWADAGDVRSNTLVLRVC